MIEINLIPANLRKKDKRGSEALAFMNLPKEFVLGCLTLFILILFIMHASLLGLWLSKSARHNLSQSQWNQMAGDKMTIDTIDKQLKDLKAKIALISKNTSKNSIIWSQKLNIISDSVPKGVWLRKISWTKNDLLIEGNAYLPSQEIAIVGNFVSSLKKDKEFMKDFKSLELNSISRIKKGATEVADFSISAKLK